MQTLTNVNEKKFPPNILEKLNATSFHKFKIIPETQIEYENEFLPPEECISQELIKAVEASQLDIKEGRCKRFDTHEELMEELQAIWNEPDE